MYMMGGGGIICRIFTYMMGGGGMICRNSTYMMGGGGIIRRIFWTQVQGSLCPFFVRWVSPGGSAELFCRIFTCRRRVGGTILSYFYVYDGRWRN